MNGKNSDRVRFGPYEADLHTYELWKFGIRLKLVGQPFEVLAILLSKPGDLVTREELRDRLWPGDTYVDFNHGLNAAVNRLREALSDSADAPRYVETLPRRGYRFIAAIEPQKIGQQNEVQAQGGAAATDARVEEIAPLPAEAAALAPLPPATESESATKRWGWRLPFLATGALLLVLGVAGTFAIRAVLRRVLAHVEANDTAPVQRIRPLTTLTDETAEPAFSADGNFVAFRREGASRDNTGIFVKGIASDQLLQLTANGGDGHPVWSPDGQTIAFSRGVNEEEEFEIYLVPLARGQTHLLYRNEQALTVTIGGVEERRLDTGRVKPTRPELDWSPDEKTMAFSSGRGIYLLPLDRTVENSRGARRLTEPPPLAEDWGPTFSPDGRRILFARRTRAAATEEIMVVAVRGGDATLVTSDPAGILSPPRWSTDGSNVIFGSSRGSHAGLWRTSVDTREAPVEINDGGWYPTLSQKGYRMAYQRAARGMNIWQLDLSSIDNQQRVLVPSTSQTDQGPGPQFSPDGKKLAYMSDRSGTMEIWVSDRDGRNPVQLTALGNTGTPRWSPDSQWIAFDRRGAVYVVSVAGGAPRLLAPDNASNACPSWSADGKWLYFASARTHQFQVWKTPVDGGDPVQVTFRGGHAPLGSQDGRYIYYAKTEYANPEIWQVPAEGGAETQLSALVHPATWASWAVTDRGILFAGPSGTGRPIVSLFDFATHRVAGLGVLNIPPFWLGATRDGKTVAFDQPGSEQDQVMLVENFR